MTWTGSLTRSTLTLCCACGPASLDTTAATTTAATTTTTTTTTTGTVDSETSGGSETSGESDTEVMTETDGETGVTTVECTVSPGDHAEAVCFGGECPIISDVSIACPDEGFLLRSMDVAAAPEATWMATSSKHDRMLFRVATGGAVERIELPKSFANKDILLAVGPEGDLHLASSVSSGTVYLSELDGWVDEVASDNQLLNLQVDDDGAPHIWLGEGAPAKVTEAVRSGGGDWAVTPIPDTSGGAGLQRFARDGAGRLLAANARPDGDFLRIGVTVDGDLRYLGTNGSYINSTRHFLIQPRSLPLPPPGPPFAGLLDGLEGVEIAWPLDGDEAGSVLLPAQRLMPWCQGYSDDCPPCEDKASGYEYRTASFARTPDGLAWGVLLTTQLDKSYVYDEKCDGGGEGNCICEPSSVEDASYSDLHLFRVALDGSEPVEVLTLPVGRVSNASLGVGSRAHAFGSTLAISLRVHEAGSAEYSARVFRIDTADLLP